METGFTICIRRVPKMKEESLIGVWVICIFLSCVQQKKILNPRLHFAFQQRGYNKQNGDVAILAAYHLVFDGDGKLTLVGIIS